MSEKDQERSKAPGADADAGDAGNSPAAQREAPGDGAHGRGRSASLGDMLVQARKGKGLELSDIGELTHVRQEYLRALEEARYRDLPEDVYTRNYVRLYAQAVGLDAESLLDVYLIERRRIVGMSTLEERLEKERRGEVPEADRRARLPFGTLLPTLALVAVLVGMAVWGFNSLLFRPARGPAGTAATGTAAPGAQLPGNGATKPAGGAGTAAAGAATASAGQPAKPSATTPAGVVGDAVQAKTVQVTIDTSPPGASVSIDGFALPGTTPIQGAPVTAREGRVVRVTLAGYQPLQRTVDLRHDQTLDFTLTPTPAAANATEKAPAKAVTPASVAAGQIGINITARTWLEVYHSTSRNQGERLVYATVDAGTHYVFKLPVYLHVGNAAGVDIVTSDKDLGNMGSPGAVVSKAFPAP